MEKKDGEIKFEGDVKSTASKKKWLLNFLYNTDW